RRAEARRTMEDAMASLTEAIDKWPGRPDLRLQMLRIHNVLGTMLLGAGDQASALEQYRMALSIGEGLLASRPKDLVLKRDLADCYTSLGRYYERYDPAQARDWYQRDLEIWTEWPRLCVSNRVDQARRDEAARNVARCTARTG